MHDPSIQQWAALLYVAAQFTARKSDSWKDLIHLKAQGDELSIYATDGVSMVKIEGKTNHTLSGGGHYTLDPTSFRKKPGPSKNQVFVGVERDRAPLPFTPYNIDKMAKEVGRSSVNPELLAKASKSLTVAGQRVDLFTGRALTQLKVIGGFFPDQAVTAYVANLA